MDPAIAAIDLNCPGADFPGRPGEFEGEINKTQQVSAAVSLRFTAAGRSELNAERIFYPLIRARRLYAVPRDRNSRRFSGFAILSALSDGRSVIGGNYVSLIIGHVRTVGYLTQGIIWGRWLKR